MTGIRLSDASIQDVAFHGCRIDLASFASTTLRRVMFDECLLTQTDFLDAQLESVRFDHCDMGELDLRGARLLRCELRDCNLDGLQGVENLRGAAMPWPEIVAMAGVWASALGIEEIEAGEQD